MVMDATTPIAPDVRGHYSQPLDRPAGTESWRARFVEMQNA